MNSLTTDFVDHIQTIPKDEWNGVVGYNYPFLRHEFLHALEKSGSVSRETGWEPSHFIARNHRGELVAAAPCYLKDHSYGEYVFDWAWANAYYQHKLDYYPKLLTAIPFTPCVGPRLVVKQSHDAGETVRQCIDATIDFCTRHALSSWHLLFPSESLAQKLDCMVGGGQLMKRTGSQFHWYNYNYESFADYLARMTSRKRKTIRKEREKVAQQGITFANILGSDLSASQLDDFYLFYHATYMKRGQHGYLNRHFFELLLESMADNLLFIFAQKNRQNIAVAFFLKGNDTLFGRNWGCLEEYKHLHFETCYYQGIDYCIREKLAHFDAGAQGEHKIQRGFEPIKTYSYHWIGHAGFRAAIGDYLAMEEADVCSYVEDAREYLPFKQEV